jgi:hypothetical protein
MRPIRASELGSFLFCRRAWWYHSQGIESQNQQELTGGSEFHDRHGQGMLRSAALNAAGRLLLVLALVALAIGLTLFALR